MPIIAVHLQNGRVSVKTQAKARRPLGFASIRLLYGGICNTDLELQRGYYGFQGTPGHEFVGQVIAADTSALVGKRVVGEINLACTRCDWCRRGLGRHCPNRTVLGIVKHPGAFREILTLPERNLHLVPDSVSNEHAVFAEPVAAACEILDQVEIPLGAKVAVLGDGKLGLLIAQVLQSHGARVHQFGRHRDKLRISERCGVTTEIAGKLPKGEYQWVVDATGSAAGLKDAISMAVPRGTVVMKSTVHGKVMIDTAAVVVNEIRLVGSRCGRFEPALDLLEKGKLRLDDMIAETLRLDRAPEAFRRAGTKGTLKVLLKGEG